MRSKEGLECNFNGKSLSRRQLPQEKCTSHQRAFHCMSHSFSIPSAIDQRRNVRLNTKGVSVNKSDSSVCVTHPFLLQFVETFLGTNSYSMLDQFFTTPPLSLSLSHTHTHTYTFFTSLIYFNLFDLPLLFFFFTSFSREWIQLKIFMCAIFKIFFKFFCYPVR